MIAKSAGYTLLVALVVVGLSCGTSDRMSVSAEDVVVELLVIGRYVHASYVYYGSEELLRELSLNYWSSTRMLGGDECGAEPSHRFFEADLDALQCPEVVSVARQLEVDTANVTSVSSWCNQEKGLIAYHADVLGAFPEYEKEHGKWRYVTTWKASILDMIAIYHDDSRSWQFVDSMAVNPRAEGEGYYSLGSIRIDNAGANCYYRKRNHVLRYNLQDGIIDTLPECDWVGVPSNSMHLLTLSTDGGILNLLDEHGRELSSVRSDLKRITDVAMVNDDAFVVAGWRHWLFGIGRKWVVQLVDFSASKTEELCKANGVIEILSVEVLRE